MSSTGAHEPLGPHGHSLFSSCYLTSSIELDRDKGEAIRVSHYISANHIHAHITGLDATVVLNEEQFIIEARGYQR